MEPKNTTVITVLRITDHSTFQSLPQNSLIHQFDIIHVTEFQLHFQTSQSNVHNVLCQVFTKLYFPGFYVQTILILNLHTRCSSDDQHRRNRARWHSCEIRNFIPTNRMPCCTSANWTWGGGRSEPCKQPRQKIFKILPRLHSCTGELSALNRSQHTQNFTRQSWVSMTQTTEATLSPFLICSLPTVPPLLSQRQSHSRLADESEDKSEYFIPQEKSQLAEGQFVLM